MSKKFKIIFVGVILLTIPFFARADYFSQKVNFFVEPSYDLNKREQLSATLQKVTPQLYFYIDDNWWSSLDYPKKQDIEKILDSLASEFQSKIYPTLTSNFGFEWRPGIDGDERITILLHPMIEEAGGYFQNGNEYSRLQVPKSNQREMFYLNTNYITTSLAKSFLAHELLHLITFNQKERIQGVGEEVWLNEARAEYVSTLLGYDDEYQGSNLQRRVSIFLDNPSDSITEWKNEKSDYGTLNLLTQYLVDHYGVKILADSLYSKLIGIPSLNEALKKNGFSEDFSQVFVNWTITVVVNDCSLGKKYCYLNKNLTNLRISPMVNFLPMMGESTLSVSTDTKDWAGNWYRFVGGKGFLKLEFIGSSWVSFKVPYLIKDIQGNYSINFLALDENQKGGISIPKFGEENIFLTIIPSVQNKISGFLNNEPSYSFFWSASIVKNNKEENKEAEDTELIKKLLGQIDSLQKEIAKVQAQINAILTARGQIPVEGGLEGCQKFERDLYYGLMEDPEVSCLQQFLKNQGQEIYPEGLISGNFLFLTQTAVQRYQAKKGIIQTGYFGPLTRGAANQDLTKL